MRYIGSTINQVLNQLTRFQIRMSSSSSPTAPPATVKGMTILDRSQFSKDIKVMAVTVDESIIRNTLKQLKKHLMHMREIKPVRSAVSAGGCKRAIYMNPDLHSNFESVKSLLQEKTTLTTELYTVDEHTLTLTYDNWSADELIRAILPDDIPSVTGYTVVGHIAHLNLKEVHLPYKSIIGQILVDKQHNIETVVNKLDAIDNTYRNFAMEVLAGKQDMDVSVKENGCTFCFDFSKVYWNSRLSTEHERVVAEVRQLPSPTVVFDVFAGVGPFSVPLAKKGASIVHANDLNPQSFKALQYNLEQNKVRGTYHTYNLDGRKFIEEVVKELLPGYLSDGYSVVFVMNLPALAVQFLDAFIGVLSDSGTSHHLQPLVYCYCFSKDPADSYEQDAADQANSVLGCTVVSAEMCRRVRNVAPKKEMVCIQFSLNDGLLTEKQRPEGELSPEPKRVRRS